MHADAVHPNPLLAQRLAHLYTLHGPAIDLRLSGSPYLDLLHKLGDPHLRLPPVVHIAGTNGKGSVLAFLRAMCEAEGRRVHVYTSPHLIAFNERIRLAGEIISDDALIALYDHVLKTNNGAALTFFEFTTALAFRAFAGTPADIILLETGVGGRLDCTNVIDKPLATIITKISYDHVALLGDTLPKIAAEKAAIMKPGVPCVIGAQMDPNAVMPVFENYAQKIGAPLLHAKPALPENYPAPNLAGAHQIENAATAIAAAELLHLSDAAKRHGLTHAQWPARMEHITTGKTAALVPPGWELWFDAAHNDSGAQALAAQLRQWKTQTPDAPIHLVVGMGANKDSAAFFKALTGLYDTLTLVDLPRAASPQTGADLARRSGVPAARLAPDVPTALTALLTVRAPAPKARICVCGSLYLYQSLF